MLSDTIIVSKISHHFRLSRRKGSSSAITPGSGGLLLCRPLEDFLWQWSSNMQTTFSKVSGNHVMVAMVTMILDVCNCNGQPLELKLNWSPTFVFDE